MTNTEITDDAILSFYRGPEGLGALSFECTDQELYTIILIAMSMYMDRLQVSCDHDMVGELADNLRSFREENNEGAGAIRYLH